MRFCFDRITALKAAGLLCAVTFAFPYDACAEADYAKMTSEQLSARIESGDSDAMYFIGSSYLYGINGLVKNVFEGEKYLLNAAEAGHLDAAIALADSYKKGVFGRVDYQRAMKYYVKAAALGDVKSLTNIGIMYMEGLGVDEDDRLALKYLKQAADKDDADASFYLGLMYRTGRGVAADDVRAHQYLERAASLGSSEAKVQLAGIMMLTPEPDAECIKGAEKLLQEACADGNSEGCDLLDTVRAFAPNLSE